MSKARIDGNHHIPNHQQCQLFEDKDNPVERIMRGKRSTKKEPVRIENKQDRRITHQPAMIAMDSIKHAHTDGTRNTNDVHAKDHFHSNGVDIPHRVDPKVSTSHQRTGKLDEENPNGKDPHRGRGDETTHHHNHEIQKIISPTPPSNIHTITEWFTQVLGIDDNQTATAFANRAVKEFLLQTPEELEEQFAPPEWCNNIEEPWKLVQNRTKNRKFNHKEPAARPAILYSKSTKKGPATRPATKHSSP